MKLKPLSLLVASLGVVAGFVYWQNHQPVADPAADPRVGRPLVAPDTLAALRGLHLVSNNQSITLAADAEGRNWTVPDYHGLPVDFDKLVGFVNALRDAKVARFVSARPDRLERLGFAGDRVELRGPDAQPLLTLHLGKNAETGGRFLKLDDEAKAYLVDLSAWLDTTAKSWARSQLLDVKAADIATVELRFADGSSLVATRNADATGWTAENLPEGKELDGTKLDSLVSQLASLRFTDTAEPTAPDAVAAKEHAQTVVVTTKDGTGYTIALGRRPAPPTEFSAIPKTGETPTAPITATTPPITIGEDGQPQVVELPKTEAELAAVTPPPPEPPKPGPVFAFITGNREGDTVNALMQRRSFQIGEWILSSLPTDRAAVLQDKPTPPASPGGAGN